MKENFSKDERNETEPVESPAPDKRNKAHHTLYYAGAFVTGLFAFMWAYLFLWGFDDIKEDVSLIAWFVTMFGISIVLCVVFARKAARIFDTMPEEKGIPTEEREIDGYRIYQNLTDEEKREIRYDIKEYLYALIIATAFCVIGYLVLFFLSLGCVKETYAFVFWVSSIACVFSALVLGVAIWVRRAKWLKRNKIITTIYQYNRLIQKK